MKKHIFLIGPGAVGKTTYGEWLGKELGMRTIDIDVELTKKVGYIKDYCDKNGYEKYHAANSNLFYKLLSENKKKSCVFVISPGMLTRGLEKLRNKNIDKINKNGVSICLMPSKNFKKSVDILFEREKKRSWYKDQNALLKKIKSDIRSYRNLGDIKVYTESDLRKKDLNKK